MLPENWLCDMGSPFRESGRFSCAKFGNTWPREQPAQARGRPILPGAHPELLQSPTRDRGPRALSHDGTLGTWAETSRLARGMGLRDVPCVHRHAQGRGDTTRLRSGCSQDAFSTTQARRGDFVSPETRKPLSGPCVPGGLDLECAVQTNAEPVSTAHPVRSNLSVDKPSRRTLSHGAETGLHARKPLSGSEVSPFLPGLNRHDFRILEMTGQTPEGTRSTHSLRRKGKGVGI